MQARTWGLMNVPLIQQAQQFAHDMRSTVKSETVNKRSTGYLFGTCFWNTFLKMTLKLKSQPSTKTTQSWRSNHLEPKHGWKMEKRFCHWSKYNKNEPADDLWHASTHPTSWGWRVKWLSEEKEERAGRRDHSSAVVGSLNLLPMSCQSTGCHLRTSVVEG